MRERSKHLSFDRSNPLYTCIQMDESRCGKVWLRMPHAIRLNETFVELQRLTALREDESLSEAVKSRVLVDVNGLFGSLLALCWASPTHELESRRNDYEDAADYGNAVIEELRETGWVEADFNALQPKLYDWLNTRAMSTSQIEARADFFDPTSGS